MSLTVSATLSPKILIADDHGVVRRGVRAIIEQQPNWSVVGEAGSGREVLAQLAATEANLVVMDLAMPELNGIETTRRITTEHSGVAVLVLSMYESDEFVHQALDAGATGMILKADASELLVPAITAVTNARPYFSPRIARIIMDGFLSSNAHRSGTTPTLSDRQREILQLIAEGRSTKEVAQVLDVSVKTVETHRTQMMKRIGARSIADVVRYAVRNGIVMP